MSGNKILTSILAINGEFEQFESNLYIREKYYNEKYRDDVYYIIVDSSCDKNTNNKVKNICHKNEWDYIYIGADANFNHSKNRNAGIKAAKTEFIIFEDIDLIQDLHFYENIRTQLLNKWNNIPFNFVSIPVAYLSRDLSTKIINEEVNIGDVCDIIKNALSFNYDVDKYIDHYIPQSSVLILKRTLALFVGGFDENFTLWGGEDRDFVFRMLACNTRIALPKDFSYTSTEYGHNINKYVGWKSLWTIHGDYGYEKGFMSFHLYHEERTWRDKKYRGMKNPSIVYCENKFKTISTKYNIHFTPIGVKNNIFIYGRNPHLITYELFESLGGFNIIEENISYEKIVSQINKDSMIIFWNPYGSQQRLAVFKQLKKEGYSVLVAERGALPDSIVFDQDDLVIFSKSYDKKFWDKPISAEERERTVVYLQDLIQSSATLEKNANKKGSYIVKHELGTHVYEHVLLCCLQLQSDTVTNQVVEGKITYHDYIEEIKLLAQNLPFSCKLLIKNHPLSKIKISIPGTICVDHYHLHDLIEISNAIIVYNSGTGIIARAFKKPVFCFGPSSYNDNRFTYDISSYMQVISNLNSLIKIEDELVIRYFSYIINHLYSFAKFYDHTTKENNDAILIYPSRIAYYSINILDRFKGDFNRSYFIPEESYLFKRFYNYKGVKKNQKQQVKKIDNKIIETTNPPKRLTRKINKLLHNPVLFFKDSKYYFLQKIGSLLGVV